MTPYFATAPLPVPRGRMLLVTYHFPPGIAVGGLRWQKMARVASERGWELDVLALDPAALDRQDPSRLHDLPPGVRVFGVPVPRSLADVVEAPLARAHALARRLRSRREGPMAGPASTGTGATAREEEGSVAVADIHFNPLVPRHWSRALNTWIWLHRDDAWARRAARVAEALYRDGARYAAVITSGPPHQVHAALSPVARRFRAPHIVDMRDPWTLQQRLVEGVASPLYFWLSGRAERRALAGSELLVCNTIPFLEAMRMAFPGRPAHRMTVMNGWDPEAIPPRGPWSRFGIAYAGSIYLDRNPRPLFEAARRVIERHGLTPDDLGIEFMGSVHAYRGRTIEAIAAESGVGPFVRTLPTGGRREVLQFLSTASVLVSLPQDSDLAIPSKVFEYMLFPAWLLVLAGPGSATAQALADTSAAVIDPNDVESLANRLELWYGEFRKGKLPVPLSTDDRLSRRGQAELLFDTIERDVLHLKERL
jgi:hypothetical protein